MNSAARSDEGIQDGRSDVGGRRGGGGGAATR